MDRKSLLEKIKLDRFIALDFETTGLTAGEYAYDLQIETNDYENSNINIPINLNVLEDSCAGLSPGDINQDNQ